MPLANKISFLIYKTMFSIATEVLWFSQEFSIKLNRVKLAQFLSLCLYDWTNGNYFCPVYKWASTRENVYSGLCEQQGTDQPVHPHSLISTFAIRLSLSHTEHTAYMVGHPCKPYIQPNQPWPYPSYTRAIRVYP